ncbi:MAG: thioredoxin family protein [Tenuifilaceae bacterium]|jgi:thioredoxin-related protein|nr:thioredoxin family protein [Tenuifilaceae bacterium]
MKKLIFTFLLSFSGLFFASAQEWYYNLEQAKSDALNGDKLIVMVFQGSDWCAPCIKLDKEIWSNPEFRTYWKEHYALVKVDFPRKKQNKPTPEQEAYNKKLAEEFNKSGGFPMVVILDKTGKVLGRTGYKGVSVSEYIEHINSFAK